MELILDFFKSDLANAIGWLVAVITGIYAVIQKKENKKLKIIINSRNHSNIDTGQDSVEQKGKNNVYTKSNSGDMNINM